MKEKRTKVSKCFGYLNFFSAKDAQACHRQENNTEILGKSIILNFQK